MSNIPRARELVMRAMNQLPSASPAHITLQKAISLMNRESPVKRVKPRSRMMTAAVACEIWRYYRLHPRSSHQEIADALRVNPGRVSEVLTGTRYPEAKSLSLKEKA